MCASKESKLMPLYADLFMNTFRFVIVGGSPLFQFLPLAMSHHDNIIEACSLNAHTTSKK